MRSLLQIKSLLLYLKKCEMDLIAFAVDINLCSYCSILCILLHQQKLDKKLRENLRDARNSLFTTDSVQSGQIRSVSSEVNYL